jgi:hypothetical protein
MAEPPPAPRLGAIDGGRYIVDGRDRGQVDEYGMPNVLYAWYGMLQNQTLPMHSFETADVHRQRPVRTTRPPLQTAEPTNPYPRSTR